jgi:hypothetical protein
MLFLVPLLDEIHTKIYILINLLSHIPHHHHHDLPYLLAQQLTPNARDTIDNSDTNTIVLIALNRDISSCGTMYETSRSLEYFNTDRTWPNKTTEKFVKLKLTFV